MSERIQHRNLMCTLRADRVCHWWRMHFAERRRHKHTNGAAAAQTPKYTPSQTQSQTHELPSTIPRVCVSMCGMTRCDVNIHATFSVYAVKVVAPDGGGGFVCAPVSGLACFAFDLSVCVCVCVGQAVANLD